MANRIAGMTVPLFAIRTESDFGIGEVLDLPLLAQWVRTAGFSLVQVLPVAELSQGETSPYGALSAFGIDPIYLSFGKLEDCPPLDEVLTSRECEERDRLRHEPRVRYQSIRPLKEKVLRACFARFRSEHFRTGSERMRDFERFCSEESSWLAPLSLYSALRRAHQGHGWETWPEGLRNREPSALAEVERSLEEEVALSKYAQWQLRVQWTKAREDMRKHSVSLMGDLPFIVCRESADVWNSPRNFRMDCSLGAPPDDFSSEGQDWGLPAYHWDEMDRDGLGFLRRRAAYAAKHFDSYRIDHVVGLFRQWIWTTTTDGKRVGSFTPSDHEAQIARGLLVLGAMQHESSPAAIIAEDLGVIPPFVRASLKTLGIPGYRVLPWEKDGDQLRDPTEFPSESVVTWSTHDTAPITAWFDELSSQDRRELCARAKLPSEAPGFARTLGLLSLLMHAASDRALVLAQEVLEDRSRINTPGVVDDVNWTYRLPAPIESLARDPEQCERMAALAALLETARRAE